MDAKNRKLTIADVVTEAQHTGSGEGLEAAAVALGVVTKEAAAAEKARQQLLVKGGPAKLIEARREIKLSQLIESKKNHRKDFGDVDSLGAAMLAQGQLTALTVVEVNPDVFEIVAGARRFRAAKKAGMKTLACDVYEATAEQAMEMRIAENLERKDLTVMEEAEQLGELKGLGYTPQTIAKRFDKSVGWAHSRLKLLDLGPEARALVSAGKLPSSVGTPIGRLPSALLQKNALQALETNGLVTVDGEHGYRERAKWSDDGVQVDARRAITFIQEQFTRSLKSTNFDQSDATLLPVETALATLEAGGGACTSCPFNSDNMPDVEKGKGEKGHAFCAFEPCHSKKTEIAWEATAAKAEEKGAKVLDVEESKKVRVDSGQDYAFGQSYGGRYVAATARPTLDPKKRTYAQLVKDLPEADRPTEIVRQGETGKPEKMYERSAVEKALAEVHAWAKKKKERSSSSPAESKEAKAKRQRQERVSLEALRQVITAIRKKAPAVGELRAIALAAIDADLGYELQDAIEPHVEGDGLASLFGFKTRKDLEQWVEKKAKAQDLVAVIYVFTCGDAYGNVYGGYSAEVKDATTRHKVDLKKLEKADDTAAEHEAAKAK